VEKKEGGMMGNFARMAQNLKTGGANTESPTDEKKQAENDAVHQSEIETPSAGRAMVGRMAESEIDMRAKVISISLIDPDPEQPRIDFKDIEEKAGSIRNIGLIQAITVRPHPSVPGRFMVVDGERRYRAYTQILMKEDPLEFSEIRASIIDDPVNVGDLRVMQLIANIQRQDLNPIEEANALQLIKGLKELKTNKELAEEVGKSETRVSRLLKLLQLNAEEQSRVLSGELSARDVQNSKGVEAVRGVAESPKQEGRVAKISISMTTATQLVEILQTLAKQHELTEITTGDKNKKDLVAVLESRSGDILRVL